MSTIISADEIKKQLPGYHPRKVELFHRESARLADKQFDLALKTTKYKKVILLNGGTASGKTEFLSTQLAKKRFLILDATLATEEGAKIKIGKIVKSQKQPIIYAIIPDDLKRAFTAFLNRERKFSDTHFYKTHSGSRKTLLWVATNYPAVSLLIVESYYTAKEELHFTRLKFKNYKEKIQYLAGIQMTETDIVNQISLIKSL